MLSTIPACHVIPAKALSTDIIGLPRSYVVDAVGCCKLTREAKDGMVSVTDAVLTLKSPM